MAYTLYDPTKPDATAQTLTQMGQSERANFNAIRDAAICGGGFFGFNLAVSGGSADQPAQLLYSKGTERVKVALTWGTAGGEAGSVTVAAYAYSNNSGTDYTVTPNGPIGTKTITYDATGNVVSTLWA